MSKIEFGTHAICRRCHGKAMIGREGSKLGRRPCPSCDGGLVERKPVPIVDLSA